MALNTRHVSIQTGSALPDLSECDKCCRLFHCPFCATMYFRPTRLYKLKAHMKSHLSKTVVHKEFTIHRCGQECRSGKHYHCPYCDKKVLRSGDFRLHLDSCKEGSAKSSDSSAQVQVVINEINQAKDMLVLPLTPLMASVKRARLQPAKRISCPFCNILLNKKNLKKHIDRKHLKTTLRDINALFHMKSECIDRINGIYAVSKIYQGQSVPLHVQSKTWGEHHKVKCESQDCQTLTEVAQKSCNFSFLCVHLRSVIYCKSWPKFVHLTEQSLSEMVDARWIEEEKKRSCLIWQQQATTRQVPLSIESQVGTPETKKFISVFEKDVSYYSQLGRVMVVYDTIKNTWHCPCAKMKRSCMHKYVAKWHLFQTQRCLFRTPQIEKLPQINLLEQDEGNNLIYPPKDQGLMDMVTYLYQCKKIPAVFPDNVKMPSPEQDYPRLLFPEEINCKKCPGTVPLGDAILITNKAKIITNWSIIQDVATYCKRCPQCYMFYRYQEQKDHLHNFNDHTILTIPLCLTLRSLLQVHTSVSRVVEHLEDMTGLKYPSSDTMLHAYLHFEALTDHIYQYSCIKCGDFPPVVIMDLHKKGVFKFSAGDIEDPPESFNGEVNIEGFWDALSKEMIGRGFVASGAKNPFAVKPTYHFWAPWIGKSTRKSDDVLNTENEKRRQTKISAETEEITVTEERLQDELQKQKMNVIRNLCKECGLDSTGSRADLLLRLSAEMKSRQTYDKLFEKVWGASGGWGVIMCPCGIVYSLKCNLRAESPRDFADLLFSWKHLPNVTIYDFARGLATHGNLRAPETVPFRPYEGRLAEPTTENIALAKSGMLKVSLPWLVERESSENHQVHPLTGSSDHYVLADRFHEGNSKDSRDVLRRIALVPQLAGKINTQVAEQLFSKMRKNNYFLNMSQPSTHLFQMRTIIHLYNEKKNNSLKTRLMKTFGSKLTKNIHGQSILETSSVDFAAGSNDGAFGKIPSTKQEIVCKIKNVSASRMCWDHLPNQRQSAMLESALGADDDDDETVVKVGTVSLKRKDFWSLGRNEQLEATIANSCLTVIEMIAKEKGLDVWTFDAYVVATWLPPNDQDPALSFPENISQKDSIIIPAWKPGHWMLCVMNPKDKHMYFIDSINPYGVVDENYVNVFRKMTTEISPGPWQILKKKEIPKQIGGVDCGVFMLMYALHLVLGAPFDFTSFDLPKIRRWWTLILLENFDFTSERAKVILPQTSTEKYLDSYSQIEVKPKIKDSPSFL